MRLKQWILAGAILTQFKAGIAQRGSEDAALAASVQQLRNAVGKYKRKEKQQNV